MIGYENDFPDHHETYGASPEELERQQADNLKRAAAIRAYEESINRPYQDRWIKTEAGKQNLNTDTVLRKYPKAQQTDLIPAFRQYADKCKEYLAFGQEVDLAIEGKLGRRARLRVREHTPASITQLGLEDLPMLYTQSHLLNALKEKNLDNPSWHGLTREYIKEIPELLEKPAVVMESLNGSDSLVVVLNKLDSDKLPIIVPFMPSGVGVYQGQEILTNFILSIYGKDGISQYLNRGLKEEKILFVSAKRLERLSLGAALQLRRSYESLNGIIRQYRPRTQEVDTSQAKDAFFRELNERYNCTTALSRQDRPERGESQRKKGAR